MAEARIRIRKGRNLAPFSYASDSALDAADAAVCSVAAAGARMTVAVNPVTKQLSGYLPL